MKVYLVSTCDEGVRSKVFSTRKQAEEYAYWIPYYYWPKVEELEVEEELHLDKYYHVSLELKHFYNGEQAFHFEEVCRLPEKNPEFLEGYRFEKFPLSPYYSISLFHFVPADKWRDKETLINLRHQLSAVAKKVDVLLKTNPAINIQEFLEGEEIYDECSIPNE